MTGTNGPEEGSEGRKSIAGCPFGPGPEDHHSNSNEEAFYNKACGGDWRRPLGVGATQGVSVGRQKRVQTILSRNASESRLHPTRPVPLDYVEGRVTKADVGAIILCTGYQHHFPFLPDDLRPKTANRLATADLRKGRVWVHNLKLFYLGMQGQWFTFNMFDARAWRAW